MLKVFRDFYHGADTDLFNKQVRIKQEIQVYKQKLDQLLDADLDRKTYREATLPIDREIERLERELAEVTEARKELKEAFGG